MSNRQEKINLLLQRTNLKTEQELQEYLKREYYTAKPIITDGEYDELFGDKDYVGYTVDAQTSPWNVLEHKIPMGSLEKIKTWEQAVKWVGDRKVIWEPKLDGLSMEAVYENGILKHAILRGGGDKGEDIYKNAKNFIGVPQTIKTDALYVSVRGEVVISQSNFNKLVQLSNEAYSNRRNCIAGICRRYDGQYSNLLSFYTYDIIEEYSNSKIRAQGSETDKIMNLYHLGFKIPFAFNTMTEEKYHKYADIRNSAEEFQMDGLVIKCQDMSEQIALKFEPNGELTKVTGYTWEVGSTGKLVPVIHFEPVVVGGTKLTKASVGSYKIYQELNATEGSVVEVKKMNDVIPKVVRTVERNENEILEVPFICPVCGEGLAEKGTDLYCVNNDCPIKVELSCTSVYNAMIIKGITDKWVTELIKTNVIKQPADVIRVKAEDIANIEGYSLKTGTKIVEHFENEINKMYANGDKYLAQFLKMIPIPSLGEKAYEKFTNIFSDVRDFETWIKDIQHKDVNQLKAALGNAAGEKAFDYMKGHKQEIIELINATKELLY